MSVQKQENMVEEDDSFWRPKNDDSSSTGDDVVSRKTTTFSFLDKIGLGLIAFAFIDLFFFGTSWSLYDLYQ